MEACLEGKVYGPIKGKHATFRGDDLVFIPLGAVRKKDAWGEFTGDYRLVENYSFPNVKGRKDFPSINTAAAKEDKKCRFPKFREICVLSSRVNFIGKVDWKGAFRQIRLHPDSRRFTAKFWQDMTFIDGFLPFGLAVAPKEFSVFARTFIWIVVYKYPGLFTQNLFDRDMMLRKDAVDLMDFLHVEEKWQPLIDSLLDDAWYGNKDWKTSMDMRTAIHETAVELGIVLHPEKDSIPARVQDVLGTLFDLDSRSVRLTDEKDAEYLKLIDEVLQADRISVRNLMRLHGKLNVPAIMSMHMRPFLRSTVDMFIGKNLDWVIKLDPLRVALHGTFFRDLIRVKSMMIASRTTPIEWHTRYYGDDRVNSMIASDASTEWGLRAVDFDKKECWMMPLEEIPTELLIGLDALHEKTRISFLELLAAVIAQMTWDDRPEGRSIGFWQDNVEVY